MNPVRFFSLRRFWMAAVCALVFSGCGGSAKNDPAAAMDRFFALLAKQQYQEAFESTSVAFQTQLSEPNFQAIVKDLMMGDFLSIAWTPEAVTDKEAHLNGDFLSKNNQHLTLDVTLIWESGRWKLFAMRTPSPTDKYKMVEIFSRINKGIMFDDAFTRKLPDEEECRALVRETLLKFNECLHQKNFDDFFADTSQLWQSQATPEAVSRAFKPFLDAGVTMDFVKDMKPIFEEPPRFDAQGHLLIKGYYPTVPNKVEFNFQYVYELPKWKLLGITVNFKP